jgi:hypothetical protein
MKSCLALVFLLVLKFELSLFAFEGQITAKLTRGGDTQTFCYTVGTNCVRLERGETNRPYAINLIARDTGAVTLVFPHNRSFVRLPVTTSPVAPRFPAGLPAPAMPAMSAMPAAPVVPASMNIGPTNLSGMPVPPSFPAPPGGMPAPSPMPMAGLGGGMPAMPMMPMPGEPLELTATGDKTNLLGRACAKYEIKQRGQVMEIWATEEGFPFRIWQQNQPPRFGPPMIDEKWADLIRAKKLFPLLAALKFDGGGEQLRFEVTGIKLEKIKDPDGTLFQPPSDYHELEPLPF